MKYHHLEQASGLLQMSPQWQFLIQSGIRLKLSNTQALAGGQRLSERMAAILALPYQSAKPLN